MAGTNEPLRDYQQQLAQAQETIRSLQQELQETNRGLVALTLELEKRVDARTSELRATQAELQRTNAELLALTRDLEKRVAERTNELQQAVEHAQAADRAKTLMIANVSHEMRTPLSSIIGFSNLLLSRQVKPEKLREYVTTINGEGRRLAALVNDFLDLRQIESGRLVLHFISVNLADLIQDILRKREDLDSTRSIRLALEPTQPVQADPDRIRQVLLNLLSNALKFSDGEIVLSLHQEQDFVHVSVRDHGMGIPPNELGRLFELFWRGELAEQQRVHGTGLGLALCKEIIELHQGQIWAESAGEGQGATFHFMLPVSAES